MTQNKPKHRKCGSRTNNTTIIIQPYQLEAKKAFKKTLENSLPFPFSELITLLKVKSLINYSKYLSDFIPVST
jgi:hypothetical protein